MNKKSPTVNQDGSHRKIRVNSPNNFKWDEDCTLLAFFCHKARVNQVVMLRVADKIGVSKESLKTRIGEFRTYQKHGKTDKVTALTVKINLENDFRTADECERKINLFLGENIEEDEMEAIHGPVEISELSKPTSSIQLVETNKLIESFLSSKVVDFNGPFLNSDNLVVLRNIESLDFIETGMIGCYFIFSDMPVEMIPVLGQDGLKCYENYIEKDGTKFRCLYNGKGNSVKERLKLHLFNPFTLEKINKGLAKTISGTGAMSLESYPEEVFKELQKAGKYDPSKHKLKPVEKSIQDTSLDKREGHLYFMNGIDIVEEKWKQYQFAVIVLKSDSEFGKILIEESFSVKNGRPPLCKRHG